MAIKRRRIEIDAPVSVEHYWFAYRIARLSTRIERKVTSIHSKSYHLNLASWRVLANVARYQPLSQKQLGQYTATEAPKVTRAVGVLVAKKLITDTKDKTDRRRSVLRLTRKGRGVFEGVAKTIGKAEKVLFSDLSAKEKGLLRSWLERMEKQLDSEPLSEDWSNL
jgi:DNA-binding MarR family transcriptional regulator